MGKIYKHFKDAFDSASDGDAGNGCETCGYGATPTMSKEAFETLLRQIDIWAEETFNKTPHKK